ncbi:MAG: right-handed parallel beta-helix repeat-containing protein [Pirellulaceae bacterium]
MQRKTLDGFTITNVGTYDDAQWQKHFESKGEELGDDEGSVQAEGTTPAISIRGVNCTVTNCIVHHNGDVGIGVLGKENTTTAPLIANNFVYRNMGGGIDIAEGAEPIIRGNTFKENLRPGIGCRKANPIISDNVCFQNIRAPTDTEGSFLPMAQWDANNWPSHIHLPRSEQFNSTQTGRTQE